FYSVVQVFLSITPAAVYLIACLLLANGQPISAGTIVAFTTLQTRLYFPIGQLLQVSVELRSSLALFDRIFEYLDLKPDITDAPDAVDLPSADGGGRVALRDVYFRYSGVSEDALRGVSFEADPGQLVALVGPSGAGKTTISYLIPRLYDVTGGAIEIDGIDVRRVRQASLATAIGFVTQEATCSTTRSWPTWSTAGPAPPSRRSRRRPGGRTSTTGSCSSPTATTPSWASGATGCPAGRSSGWPSPGSCCTTRAS
ncbi:MAG: ATP-binding cassette domain-containing protein, partial [Streptosporangiaceae bacterium]